MHGGIVGYTTAIVSKYKVEGNNTIISGTAGVGGIAGRTNSSISNCSANIYTICATEFSNKNAIYELYIGGIVGYTTGKIENSSASVSNIGNGNVIMPKRSSDEIEILGLELGGINKYFVGGIAGYTSGYITNSSVNNNVKVKGGKILYSNDTSKPDPKAFTCTGGLVGYKNSSQEANGWQINCYVSGYDNVGGIIGYNNNGKITNITRNTAVYGSGENIGGIVGLNKGGDITNCTNNATVTGIQESDSSPYGENVGGIVGLNSGKNIIKCHNNKTVTGDKNVGGIVGISYGALIDSCSNKNKITGKSNTLLNLSDIEGSDLLIFYNISGGNATGTGGIAGKIHGTTISKTYNDGVINCNFNGGGITGLCAGGTIKYCFNKNTVTNQGIGYDGSNNRLGGICGAGNALTMECCYNIGNVTGKTGWGNTPLASPVGGLVGFLVDDSSYLATSVFTTKYLKIDLGYLHLDSYHNSISYCYNAGSVKGHYSGAGEGSIFDIWDQIKNMLGNLNKENADENEIRSRLWYNGAIVGYVGVGIDIDLSKEAFSTTTFTHNYYLSGSSESGGGRNGRNVNSQYQPLGETAFKEKLYNWASTSGVTVPSGENDAGKYIYNTVAPLQTNLGYKGYGILWWQIQDYVKLTSNIFMCSREDGKQDTYINFPNAAYNQTIHINGKTINFRNVGFNSCRITKGFNQPVKSSGCYRWIMMVPKGTYKIKGTTDFSEESQLFVNNNKQSPEKVEYSINIQNNTQLHIAPIIKFISAELNAENINVVWDRINTDVEAESKWFSDIYDANHNKINKVRGYYELDPNDSKATIKNGGKSVSVYLDKYDQLTARQPIRFYRFEYYTREQVRPSIWAWEWYYRYNGPYVTNEGTDSGKKGKAEQASCTIYVKVQNLVDLLGDNAAKNYIPHTAQVNMNYNINMWFEAGDFGSLWTNAFNLKDSNLTWNISIQKYANGNWTNIKSIPYGKSERVTNSDNKVVNGFDKDGYYSVYYGVNNEDISGSLADVKYNDELRIAIHVTFKSVSAHSYFNVNSAKLNITYGPNIK